MPKGTSLAEAAKKLSLLALVIVELQWFESIRKLVS